LPNGTQTSYTYDPASQVTSILHKLQSTGAPLNQAGYAYNAVGNRTSLTDKRGTQSFGYDPLDRLTSASHPLLATPQSFAYDPVGNRTTNNSLYNVGNQLTEDTQFTYTYDLNGNLTKKTFKVSGNHTDYIYDAENRLVKVEEFAASASTPGAVSSYRYDGLGRRIEKIGNGITRRYVYDGEDILLEYDGANTLQARYTHGPGIDEPIAMSRGGATYFYHQDGLGTVTELTDGTGAVAQSYAYDAYGTIIQQTGTVENPYTYTGREFDAESGLYYYRARHYDPRTGRFLQKDPIGLAGGINPYTYVLNNPLKFIDPTGLDTWIGLEGSTIFGIGPVAVPATPGVGAVMNLSTGERCTYTIGCFRAGLNLIAAAGTRIVGTTNAPRCGKDIGGLSTALAGDVVYPSGVPGGGGGSLGFGGGAIGGGASVGLDVGAGVSFGIEFCATKVQKCFNTPSDCKSCQENK